MLTLALAGCEYVLRRENARSRLSGTGETHIALGLNARQKGLTFAFTTAAELVSR